MDRSPLELEILRGSMSFGTSPNRGNTSRTEGTSEVITSRTLDLGSSLSDSPVVEQRGYSLRIPRKDSSRALPVGTNPALSISSGAEQLTSFRLDEVESSNPRESEVIHTLLDQLTLLSDRNESLKAYLESLESQVHSSKQLALADLASKRIALIAQLDAFVETQNRQLEALAGEKLRQLREVEGRIELYGRKMSSAMDVLSDFLDGQQGEYRESIRVAEEMLEMPGPEVSFTSDWAYIQEIPFIYTLQKTKSQQKSEKRRKDDTIKDLLRCYKQLETLYHQVRKGANPNTASVTALIEQNKALEQRIE